MSESRAELLSDAWPLLRLVGRQILLACRDLCREGYAVDETDAARACRIADGRRAARVLDLPPAVIASVQSQVARPGETVFSDDLGFVDRDCPSERVASHRHGRALF